MVLQGSESEIVATLKHWVIDQALPLWAEVGWNKRTGIFIERHDADGTPNIRRDGVSLKPLDVVAPLLVVASKARSPRRNSRGLLSFMKPDWRCIVAHAAETPAHGRRPRTMRQNGRLRCET